MIQFVKVRSSKPSSLLMRLSLLLVLAGLLLPAPARAQVSYTGPSPSVNFGSQAIGTPSAAQTLNFSISSGTTVGSIGVLTQGVPNLDFTSAAGSTCTATTYTSVATCTVKVILTPKAAGLAAGAVVFFSEASNTGTILANVPVYGIGTGSQIAYGPGTATAIAPTVNGKALSDPLGLAADAAGDLFIMDAGNARVLEVPAGGGTAIATVPTLNGKGLGGNGFVALDGAGDLFISDRDNARVLELPVGGGAPVAIVPAVNGGVSIPTGIAVDGGGDLFIVDSVNLRVVEVPAGGGAAIAIVPEVGGQGLLRADPYALAVDAEGDLFIGNGPPGGEVEVLAGGGLSGQANGVNGRSMGEQLTGMAVDAAGDLFEMSNAEAFAAEFLPNGVGIAIEPTVNGLGLAWNMTGMALDGEGNLFISDTPSSRVVKIEHSQLPALTFPTATYVGSTDTTDGTQTVQIQNIGNQPLIFTAISYPADFSEASGDASACTSSTSLNPGQECDLPIQFTPHNAGALTESVTLTDNALDVLGAKQNITLSGTGAPLVSQTITVPAIATQRAETSVPLTAATTSGLPVSFTSLTPAICTVSASTVFPIAYGTCTIQASQAGNSVYAAAPTVYRTFWVNRGLQTITFPATAPQYQYELVSLSLTATASSGLAVSYTSTTPSICTVSGNTASMIGNGGCTIEATQAGNSVYNAAAAVFHSFWVNQPHQIITFPAIATQYGLTTITLAATSNYSLTVSYTSLTPAICTVSASSASLLGPGTCTIQASQAGNSTYPAAAPVKQSFTVTRAAQTISFPTIAAHYAVTTVGLTATASSGLAVSFTSTTPNICTVSGTTATLLIGGGCTIEATQAGNGGYLPAPVVYRGIWVNLAHQTITSFPNPGTQVEGTNVTLTATASSGLPVSFVTLGSPNACTVSGTTATLFTYGECSVEAIQNGDAAYNPATGGIAIGFLVLHSQTITFPTIPAQSGVASLSLSATASSGLTVSFASTTPTVCTVAGTTASLFVGGTCTIQATQAGNGNSYGPAPTVNQSFTVTAP